MKKTLLLIMLCLGFVSFTTNLLAQSTQIKPFNGATHTYGFADVEANTTYEFYVVASNDHLGTAITNFGQFVDDAGDPLTDGTGAIGPAVANATIKIKWADNASTLNSGNGFYLFFKVKAAGSVGTDCGFGNYKGIHILPVQNDFNIALKATPNEDPICANLSDLKPVINLLDINATNEYVAGTTDLTYTVTRTPGTGNNWDADITIACSDAGVNYSYSVNTTTATTGTGDGTIELRDVDKDEVIVTVTVTNTPGSNPAITLNLISGLDRVTNLTDLNVYTADGDDTNDDADTKAVHTINLMPKIGDFIGS